MDGDPTGCSALLVWIIGIGIIAGIYLFYSKFGIILTVISIVGFIASTYIILVLLSYKEHKQNHLQHNFRDFWKFED